MSDTSTSTWAGRAKILAWNLFAILLGAELITLGLYYARTGDLYYLDPPSGRSVAESLTSLESYRIHPYFGFQLRPHSGDRAGGGADAPAHNNHGFRSPRDYPRPRAPGEFLVGIFGGSVASHLALHEAEHGVIARELAEAGNVDPADIVVLDFAQGGFKQPQQVQVLSYFLAVGQELDAVVAVDGFNEVVLGALNRRAGIGAAQPSVEHVLGLQAVTPVGTSPRREAMVEARRAYDRFAEIYNRAWSGEAPETKVAVGFLWHFLRYKYYDRRFTNLRREFLSAGADGSADASWLHLQSAMAPAGGDEVHWPAVLDVWEGGARAFAAVARGHGIPSVHVLQPNQYFPTGRSFGDAEREVAFSAASPYRELVRAGYPRLAERATKVAQTGPPVHGLFHLFDDLDAPAYSDDCCHYTDAGNDLLATRVGELLAEEIGSAR